MIRPLRAIVLEARYDATPAQVWQALTDASALADWFAPHVKADQHAGGTVEFSWDPATAWPTTIEVWDPEHHLRWADPPEAAAEQTPQPRVIVDWFISTEGGQTVLRLVHSGFSEDANWDEQIDGLNGGWTYFMWNLGFVVTRHLGAHRTLVSSRRKSAVSRAALWDSLFTSRLITTSAIGDPTCTLTLGDRSFAGIVQTSDVNARFAAHFPSLSDALLFIELEGATSENFHAGFWLSTYGVDQSTVDALQRSLNDVTSKLMEPAAAATL